MSRAIGVRAIAAVVTLVYLAIFIRDGLPAQEVLAPFGAVVSIATLAWLAFDRWLWRLPLVRQHVAQRPLRDGTWRGTVTPQSKKLATGQCWPTDEDVYLVIKQDYSTIQCPLAHAQRRLRGHRRHGDAGT